jgi:diguanylate cyclase (GGDEF)-like protein/PAS domain S-box-containing protein
MKSRLFRKYVLIFSTLVGCSLLVSGLIDIVFSYQESKKALMFLQQEKAQAAALRISQYLIDLEREMATSLKHPEGWPALKQRMAEVQLLRRNAALKEISLLNDRGQEVLRLLRGGVDVISSGRDFSTAKWFGQVQSGRPFHSSVYLRDGALYMTVAMAVGPPEAGITVAEIDLEFLLDGITRIKVGNSGFAYAVDAQGYLIAHPDMGLVLQHPNMAHQPQVQAALHGTHLQTANVFHMDGKPVLTAFGMIPYLNWFVFVEQPLSEAYQPLYAQAVRSTVLVLVGVVLSVLVCVALVRTIMKPIHALSDGARLIGRGVFDSPIVVETGDELEELAHEFNNMAEKLRESYASLEHKVNLRTKELLQSEQSLRQAQHIAGVGSYVFDVIHGVWSSSEVLNKLLGIDETFVCGPSKWMALIHPQERKPLSKHFINDILRKGQAFDKIFRIIRHSDQSERWVHGLGQVVCDSLGKVIEVHGTLQDITERKQMEDQVRQMAFYDSLTELPNRRLLTDRLRQCLMASDRNGYFGALMFLDMDNFKPLNDHHGHAVGDLLLMEVALRLLDCVRKTDTVARLGGDEFVVMLSELDMVRETSVSQALGVAEKIRDALSQPYRLVISQNSQDIVVHHCTASIGFTVFVRFDASIEDILKQADMAMYQAKDAGRNTIRLYE